MAPSGGDYAGADQERRDYSYSTADSEVNRSPGGLPISLFLLRDYTRLLAAFKGDFGKFDLAVKTFIIASHTSLCCMTLWDIGPMICR